MEAPGTLGFALPLSVTLKKSTGGEETTTTTEARIAKTTMRIFLRTWLFFLRRTGLAAGAFAKAAEPGLTPY